MIFKNPEEHSVITFKTMELLIDFVQNPLIMSNYFNSKQDLQVIKKEIGDEIAEMFIQLAAITEKTLKYFAELGIVVKMEGGFPNKKTGLWN